MPAGRDLADGFALTGYFLTRHVLEPRGLALADERAHFIAALSRRCRAWPRSPPVTAVIVPASIVEGPPP